MLLVDMEVKKEIATFEDMSIKMLADRGNKYFQGIDRFNLRTFWSDHKRVLPIH